MVTLYFKLGETHKSCEGLTLCRQLHGGGKITVNRLDLLNQPDCNGAVSRLKINGLSRIIKVYAVEDEEKVYDRIYDGMYKAVEKMIPCDSPNGFLLSGGQCFFSILQVTGIPKR